MCKIMQTTTNIDYHALLSVEETGQKVGIESVILHPDYDIKGRRAYSDVAVITLKPNAGKFYI